MKRYPIRLPLLLLLSLLSYNISVAQKEIDGQYYSPPKKKSSDSIQYIKSDNKYKVVFLLDPSGFITFGPSVHIEPVITRNLSVNVGVRVYNLGLLRNYLWPDAVPLKTSFLFHGSLRYYIKPKQSVDGFFFGPVIEFGRLNYKEGWEYDKTRIMGGEL
jgi:hypothetical protein